MLVYYINLLLILALAYPLCLRKPSKAKKLVYLGITFSYMWFLATFRHGIGFDYFSYIEIFEKVRAAQGFSALLALPYEPGFVLLSKLMTLFIHNHTVMYGVYELLILAPVVWFIYRYCKDAWFSTWLYVTLTFFYTSMNFTRQSLACSIVVLGYRFLRDKKPVPFLLLVLLAASFHYTALIMLPVYFVCHLPLSKWRATAYAGVTLVAYLASEAVLYFVTQYFFKSYRDSIYVTPFSPVFLFIPFTVFGACLALSPIWKKRHTESTMLLNLMMYSAIIWLFITKHFILERFSMYVYVFVLLALPQAISCLRCTPEDFALRESLLAQGKNKGPKSKGDAAALRRLSQKISDHEKYYWSAVAAALLITLLYNDFGANVNGFHNVFPYQSVLEWLN